MLTLTCTCPFHYQSLNDSRPSRCSEASFFMQLLMFRRGEGEKGRRMPGGHLWFRNPQYTACKGTFKLWWPLPDCQRSAGYGGSSRRWNRSRVRSWARGARERGRESPALYGSMKLWQAPSQGCHVTACISSCAAEFCLLGVVGWCVMKNGLQLNI